MAYRAIQLLLVVAVMGCDFWYGVSRVAMLHSFPSPDCVELAIRRVPAVQHVTVEQVEGGRPLTLTGIKTPDQVYRFHYQGVDFDGFLYVIRDYAGRTEFRQSYGDINRRVPQERIDAVWPIMIKIEENLGTTCDFNPKGSTIKEYCSGVDCPS